MLNIGESEVTDAKMWMASPCEGSVTFTAGGNRDVPTSERLVHIVSICKICYSRSAHYSDIQTIGRVEEPLGRRIHANVSHLFL